MNNQPTDTAWKIIKSSSPDEAIDIIISNPGAIGDETMEAIKRIAEGAWVTAQQRMAQALRLIERLRNLVEALSSVTDMKSLSEAARANSCFWMGRLEKLTRAFSSHALQNGETALADALNKAMDIHKNALRLTNDLDTIKRTARSETEYVEAVKARPELLEYNFLSWLGAIAHRARAIENDRKKANAIQRIIEQLEFPRRIVESQKLPFARVAGNPQMVMVSTPIPPGGTEDWFLDPSLTAVFDKHLKALEDNSLSIRLVETVVEDIISQFGIPPSASAKSSQFVHASAAFLRYVTHESNNNSNIPLALSALALFRNLLNNEHVGRLLGPEKWSYVL